MRSFLIAVFVLVGITFPARAGEPAYTLPFSVGTFAQQVQQAYTTESGLPDDESGLPDDESGLPDDESGLPDDESGLPDDNVRQLAKDEHGRVIAITSKGAAVFEDNTWKPMPSPCMSATQPMALGRRQLARLQEVAGAPLSIREVAVCNGEMAVAADLGLYLGDGIRWRLALPRQGEVRWAPLDVRALAYDAHGRLWFAAPQGVGCRETDNSWRLYTGADGLPFNDFTCMAAGQDDVWFGTTNGAIHFFDGSWSFRQGRRWLLDNHINDIVVDAEGRAWLATPAGVSCLVDNPMTLAQKAAFFESEIEKHHRRTPFGYVDPAELSVPGDKSTATPVFTDNDGHFTGNYLGAVSLGYAATGNVEFKRKADNAFRALAFLGEVTEGGTHPAPKGFIARAVVPTTGPDPNPAFDLDYDLRRKKADSLWKIIQPRWPIDESGTWYWKNDSSSDELDGHFFGYALYFDHVCTTASEKDAVRAVVRRIMDHIISHGYNLVDYDGNPTRWGRFSPDDLNRNEAWYDERGLNSMSILTYLAIAHHVTGDPKYREAYLDLAFTHGYGMNGMTQPISVAGPGAVSHQPDDNMAFMNYYHLIRYESDPRLLSMFHRAISLHWQYEKRERNPFANFVYAACCLGKTRTDQWGATELSPPAHCFLDAIDTLKRYPLDLINWPMSNAHRTDVRPILDESGLPTGKGGSVDGRVFPIDERHEIYWDLDPWLLTYNGDGKRLREGVPFLLAYYMGRAHGFIAD